MSDDFIDLTTSPWTEAVDRFGSKTPIGSALRSDDWEGMPLALRERAFWTAALTDARIVSAMRDKVVQGLDQSRPGGTGMDRSRFVSDMRNLLGAAPGDSGSLTDITSVRRLSLIWNFQMQDAHGFASRQADMDPNLLDAYPAYRLVRVESRRIPRDWYDRWGAAGAQVGWVGASKTDLVALKTSPIWIALSRFGRPWAPFDYNSGMGLEDVDRSEAEALGLLPKNQDPAERLQQLRDASAKQQQDWNDGLQASVKGIASEVRDSLQLAFGDQISFDDAGKASWTRQGPYTDWQAQGLDSAKTWQPDEPMPARIDPADGLEQLEKGVAVEDPDGRKIDFGQVTLDHWQGYADAKQRPAFLPAALRTVQSPIERWVQATQDVYITAFAKPQGGYRGMVVFVDQSGQATTYFVKDLNALDAARKGVKVQTWPTP